MESGLISATGNERGWRIASAAFCVLMLAVHVGAGFNCAGVEDFWRDVWWATQIVQGHHFPGFGPPIYELFELGPWWFYLLALPIGLTHSVSAAAVLVQVLAAMKYFLARHLGTRWLGPRFGLAFAVSTGIVGWSLIPILFPSHPAEVETAILLLAVVACRCWQRLTPGNALLFGLAAAACIHAHPTTVLYPPLIGLALIWRHRSWRAFALLALAAGVVVLSLLPPWLDPTPMPAGVARAFDKYANEDLGISSLARLLPLLRAVFVDGAWYGIALWTPLSLAQAKIALGVYGGCLAVALGGLALTAVRRPDLRRGGLVALILLAIQMAFLVLIRQRTTMWMLPSALPPAAFLIALGWQYWLVGSVSRRVMGLIAIAIHAVLAVAPFAFFLHNDITAIRVPSHINFYVDIGRWDNSFGEDPVAFVPVRRLDHIAASLCGPTVLHGMLAWRVEQVLSLPMIVACGRMPQLRFGGVAGAGPHVAGLQARAAADIGVAPDRVDGGLAWYEHVRPIAPAEGGTPIDFPRMQVGLQPTDWNAVAHEYTFSTRPGDVVALTNRFAPKLTMRSITANGAAARLLHVEDGTSVYGCAGCGAVDAAVVWHVALDGVEANLDLFVIERGKGAATRK